MKTHTAPNSVSVQLVLGPGHHPMHVAIVRRDKQQLAMYPAAWNKNRIPSIQEVQKDARWRVSQ